MQKGDKSCRILHLKWTKWMHMHAMIKSVRSYSTAVFSACIMHFAKHPLIDMKCYIIWDLLQRKSCFKQIMFDIDTES